RTQQPRAYLAVYAAELALEPHLQILRQYRRPLLLGLEHAHRPTVENHAHRPARLGRRRSISVRIGMRQSPHAVRQVLTGHSNYKSHILFVASASQSPTDQRFQWRNASSNPGLK